MPMQLALIFGPSFALHLPLTSCSKCMRTRFFTVRCLCFLPCHFNFAALSSTLNALDNACDDVQRGKRVKCNNNHFSISCLPVALHLPFARFQLKLKKKPFASTFQVCTFLFMSPAQSIWASHIAYSRIVLSFAVQPIQNAD